MDAILEQVKPETAAMIAHLANARSLSIDDFLRSILPQTDEIVNGEEKPLYETATPAELARTYLAWANSHDHNSPGLTLEDVSRETIYEDR